MPIPRVVEPKRMVVGVAGAVEKLALEVEVSVCNDVTLRWRN